jgi:hypothetical protein
MTVTSVDARAFYGRVLGTQSVTFSDNRRYAFGRQRSTREFRPPRFEFA